MKSFPKNLSAARALRCAVALPLLILLCAFNGGAPLPANVNDIQPTELKRHLSFLASPELGGRFTLSSGNRIAARYLASQLEAYGYRGAMPDGSFFQKIPFVTRELEKNSSKILLGSERTEFSYGDDFVNRNLAALPPATDAEGSLVFVGYGISSPENGHDDYAGLDAKGKIVVSALVGTPKSLAGNVAVTERRTQAAAAHGAVAILYLPDENMTQGWEQLRAFVKNQSRPSARVKRPQAEDPAAAKPIPALILSPTMAERTLATFKLSFQNVREATRKGESLTPATSDAACRIQLSGSEGVEYGQNVVGVLEGRDPVLKKEYVVLSAHYDHLKANGNVIFPGADDDGSGTSAVLEIARAFAQGERPKRSTLVLFNTGEEMGLIGSAYFTDQEPLVPLKSIVADFNIDMIGRSRPPGDTNPQNARLTDKDGVYLIGPDKHSTELFELSEQTNREVTKLKFDYTYNDENDPERLFYRSDHWNFGKNGIPIIFYFSGLHADYHAATDTVEKIDFEKMARIAKLVYATAWRTANRDRRFKLDKWKGKAAGE
jgi:Zn-dependent M28 family amino/carboxypeptidase